jgi:hypothetical protein
MPECSRLVPLFPRDRARIPISSASSPNPNAAFLFSVPTTWRKHIAGRASGVLVRGAVAEG